MSVKITPVYIGQETENVLDTKFAFYINDIINAHTEESVVY